MNRDALYAALVSLLIPALLFFNRVPYTFYWVGFVLVLAAPRGSARGRILILASLTLAFFAPRIFTHNSSRTLNAYEAGYIQDLVGQNMNPWLSLAIGGLVPFILLFALFELTRFAVRQSQTVKNWIKIFLPLVVVLLLSAAKVSTLLLLFALTLAFCTWMIVLSLGDEVAESLYRSRKNFWIFSVFFWGDPLPHFPLASLANAVDPTPKPEIDYRSLFGKTLELTALSLTAWLASWFMFVEMEIPNPSAAGTSAFVAHVSDPLTAWAAVLTLGFRFLVRIYAISGVAAFTLALFGAPLVFNVNRPWLAKSFHEFIGRTMYFYNFALTNTYWPLYIKGLRGVKLPDRLRLVILVFFSALFFSFFYHLLRGHQLLVMNGLQEGLKLYVGSIAPYLGLFSLCLALSVAFPGIWKWRQSSRVVHICKLTVFIFLYSLLYCLVLNYDSESLDARVDLIKFLLTGAR